jgi:hypothetical protein
METITIDKDISVFYIQASSFPAGVLEAHQALHAMVPQGGGRRYFGLSRPEGSMANIVYKAAAEEMTAGEATTYGLDTIVLQSGRYVSITIRNFRADIPAIGNAFQQLLQQPGIDPQGYCVEQYINDSDVACMVRLAD